MPALPYSITIPDEERTYLLTLIKARTIQAQIVDRARMLLCKSEGKTDKSIANGLGVSISKRWILNLSKSSIIWNEKIRILTIKCMRFFWFISRSKCNLMIMEKSSYRMTDI